MAGESLGTMVVGVTADITPAERALNSMASMLERFERQNQARARSAGSTGKGGSAGSGYFSPMSEEFNAEIRRMEMVQKRTEERLRFRQIRQSEMAAVSGRGTEEHMRALGEAFKSGDAERLEAVLGRANRGLEQVGSSAARTRYAVLNLGYGVQDAVTVFGTSGFAGAIRASANNLQGLGIILDKTSGGMAGLKSALMSGEFIIMGVATAVLLAANAWDSYAKSVQKANEAEAKERFKRLQPERAVEQVGREEALNRELARMQKLADAEAKRKEVVDGLVIANAKLNAAGREEAGLKDQIGKLTKEIADYDAVRAKLGRPRGPQDFDIPQLTKQQREALSSVEERGGRGAAITQLEELKGKLKGFEESGTSPEALLRERDLLKKDLDAINRRVGELQPQEIENALKKLQTLQAQAEALDEQIQKQDQTSRQDRDRLKALQEELRVNESGRAKISRMRDEEARKTTSLGVPKYIREKPEYQLTDAEIAAYTSLPNMGLMRDIEDNKKRIQDGQKTSEELLKQREKLLADIVALQEKYPAFAEGTDAYTQKGRMKLLEQEMREAERQQKMDARQAERDRKEAERQERIRNLLAKRTLQEGESDLEYRVRFLGGRRRDIERQMRIGNQFTSVAPFESSTAYEALARSRMGPSPESDTLKRILAAEEKATSALEDIREKLDPGRRERLVILESFE